MDAQATSMQEVLIMMMGNKNSTGHRLARVWLGITGTLVR